jgi:hypothetical protein
MKIAYIILAHKLPEQLVRLVKKLNTDTTSFLIHIDKKTDEETYRKMVSPLDAHDNAHFLKRYVGNWGTFSQVQATLEGIREAVALQLDFDYIVLLTGQDYPIKSNKYIHDFFEKSNGKSYLEYFSLPNKIWKSENGGMDRINYWNLYFLGRPRKIFPRFDLTYLNYLENFKLFGGSAYWCLARDCVEYIIERLQWDDSIIKFWKYVRIPDEGFFQTILLNSHLKGQLINDNFRYIDWVSTPHPEILNRHNYKQFINSNKLFARKFDATVDPDVLDMIDRVTT